MTAIKKSFEEILKHYLCFPPVVYTPLHEETVADFKYHAYYHLRVCFELSDGVTFIEIQVVEDDGGQGLHGPLSIVVALLGEKAPPQFDEEKPVPREIIDDGFRKCFYARFGVVWSDDLFKKRRGIPVKDLVDQLVLGFEVEIEGALGDAGALDDLVYRCVFNAVVFEKFNGTGLDMIAVDVT